MLRLMVAARMIVAIENPQDNHQHGCKSWLIETDLAESLLIQADHLSTK